MEQPCRCLWSTEFVKFKLIIKMLCVFCVFQWFGEIPASGASVSCFQSVQSWPQSGGASAKTQQVRRVVLLKDVVAKWLLRCAPCYKAFKIVFIGFVLWRICSDVCFRDVLSSYVTDQVCGSACSPRSLGHVAVCRWTSLGHGVVSYTGRCAGVPVHSSGLSSRDGRPALRQQDVHRTRTRSAVGLGQAGAQHQVQLKGW